MLVTFLPIQADLRQWTGDNADEITAHLGTEDWREIDGTPTQRDWWLFRSPVDGSVCAISDRAKRTRTTSI
jgi:hypothetical protein